MSNQITIKDINTLLNATRIAVKIFAMSKQEEEEEDEEDEDEEDEDEEEDEEDDDYEDEDYEDEDYEDEDYEDEYTLSQLADNHPIDQNASLRSQLHEQSVKLETLQRNFDSLLLELEEIKRNDDYSDMPELVDNSDFEQVAWLNVDNRQNICQFLFDQEMKNSDENSIELSFAEESSYLTVICIPLSKLLDQNTSKASILESIKKQLYNIDQLRLANRI